MALNVDGVHDSCGRAAVCGCTPNVAKIPNQSPDREPLIPVSLGN